jgi:hypothetical protein
MEIHTHIIPNANPRLFTNHSSINKMSGAYAKLAPMAYAIPCVTNNWVVVFANEEPNNAGTMTQSPKAEEYRFKRGKPNSKPNTNGDRI